MLNSYFEFHTATNEQDVVENMIIEAIQIYGMDIIYVPKTLVDYDALRGEDPMRAFHTPYTIEAYFDNVEGWMGDKSFLNKMGMNIDKEAKFCIAKQRFDQVLNPSITWLGAWDSTHTYVLNDGVNYLGKIWHNTAPSATHKDPGGASPNAWTQLAQVRPDEGDLIYMPLTHDIFEVTFVDFEEVFYQLGKIYVWKVTCEKFRFSHEDITTGNSAIDQIAAQLENNNSVVNDPLADNDTINTKITDFLDLTNKGPFQG